MTIKALGVCSIMCISLIGCATVQETQNVVHDPIGWSEIEASVGKAVWVCGEISHRSSLDAELVEEGWQPGLSLKYADGFSDWYEGRACVLGVIEYIGCGEGDILCTDWLYPYAIEVRRIAPQR